MSSVIKLRLTWLAFCLSIILPCFSIQAVEVIVHPSVNPDYLSSSHIRRIFTMRNRQWRENLPIRVFVLPSNNQLHKDFCIQELEVFPYQLDKIWGKLLFSGMGEPPQVMNSIEEMITTVKNTPGAIGYVDTLPKDSGVKVMIVGNAND